MREVPRPEELIDRVPDELKRAVQELVAQPSPASVQRVLDVIELETWWYRLYGSIATHYRAELVAALLPGADLSSLELLIHVPATKMPAGTFDLWLGRNGGVTVVSHKGACAIRDLTRKARANIKSLSALISAGETDDIFADTIFDGIERLRLDGAGPHAVRRILNCPSLHDYNGPLDLAIVEALATTQVESIYASGCSDEALQRLDRLPWLRALWISGTQHTSRGLLALPDCPKLTALSVTGSLLDRDVPVLARCGSLESLNLSNTSLTDRGGAALAGLARLRKLDVSRTAVADPSVRAFSTLPALEELDLINTCVTAEGISALAGCRSLRRLALDWDADEKMTAAAASLTHVTMAWSDYFGSGAV